MNRHHMRLHPGPFKEIAEGRKTYEFRLNDEKRRAIEVGDEIEFESRENPEARIVVKVEEILPFKSFDQTYDSLPREAFGGRTKADWLGSVRNYYSVEDEGELGVIAVKFKRPR